MKSRNNGKPAELLVCRIARAYEFKRILRLRKVDPPSVWLRGRPILTKNPFPDFVGSWTERGGRMIACEVKSTDDPKLSLGGNGITDAQANLLTQWAAAGAVAFVIWVCGERMAVVPWPWVQTRPIGSPRHIKWMEPGMMMEAHQGMGDVIHDFAEIMRKVWIEP